MGGGSHVKLTIHLFALCMYPVITATTLHHLPKTVRRRRREEEEEIVKEEEG